MQIKMTRIYYFVYDVCVCAYEPNSASVMLKTTLVRGWGGAGIDVLGIDPSLSGSAAGALAF